MTHRNSVLCLTVALATLAAACEDPPGAGTTTTPAAADGSTSRGTAAGQSPVTEADLGGVPVYPGGKLLQPQSSKTASGEDGSIATGTFEVPDAPLTVAAFYRRKLETLGAGNPVVETTTPAGAVMLMVDDATANRAVQVEISPLEGGSRVQVMSVEFPSR